LSLPLRGPVSTGILLLVAAAAAIAREPDCIADARCPSLDVSVAWLGDYRRNTAGGLSTGDSTSDMLQLGATWHHGAGLPGAVVTTSASVVHAGGGAISGGHVGDLQGLNNIEADHGWYLYDLWTEVAFADGDGTSVRGGLLDLNADFDTTDTGAFFVLPSFGIGSDLAQTGRNGPSIYPVTGLGLRVAGSLGDHGSWRVAGFESLPGNAARQGFVTFDLSRDDGVLLIGEITLTPPGTHKLAVGAWSYTSPFERIDGAAGGARERGNRGGYALADVPLATAGHVRFDGLLRAGVASGRFNPVSAYVGAALVANGISVARPDDAIGIAVAHARTGAAFRGSLAADGIDPALAETAVELTWRIQALPWLNVGPGLHWVRHPGADRGVHDAWVVGVRLEVTKDHTWTPAALR
jgi:porin